MKKIKLGLIAIFILILNHGFSQNSQQKEVNNLTYKLLNPEKVSDASAYISALDKADLSSHRLKNISSKIIFETGLEVEIFSAQSLADQNLLSHEISFYLEDFGLQIRPVFRLAENDFIIELHSIQEKK